MLNCLLIIVTYLKSLSYLTDDLIFLLYKMTAYNITVNIMCYNHMKIENTCLA